MKDLKNAGKFYAHYLKPYWIEFLITTILVGISTWAIVVAPTYMGRAIEELATYVQQWMNPATRAQATFTTFNHTLAIFVLLYIIDATSILISSLLLSKISGYSTGTMRVGLFRKMQRMKVNYFDSHSDGDILSRFTSDLDNIFNAMNQALIEIFLSGAQFIGIIWMMFTQNATLAWITMASTPVAIGLSAFVMHQASVSVDRQQDDIGRLNGYINEQITGQKMLITNGLQQESVAGFQPYNAAVRKSNLRGQIWSGILNPLLMGLSLLNTAIVIFAGSWLALNGSLSQGAALALVVVFVNYAQQYYQPIVQLTSLFNMIQLAITGARRITEVREQPDEVDPPEGKTLDGLKHELLIDNVHFSYIPGKKFCMRDHQ
ncbi:putative ABC transporter ATP-binding protein, partial [Lacticaseibacillus paracasei subsp. paracasei Lpp227]